MSVERLERLWGWDLTFGKESMEKTYREHHRRSVAQMAGHIHKTTLFIGFMTCVSTSIVHKIPFQLQLMILANTTLIPVVPVYLSQHHRAFFSEWYDEIVIAMEALAAGLTTYLAPSLLPNLPNPGFSVFTWSPIPVLFTTAVVNQTKHKTQIAGQLACMVLSHFWIYSICGSSFFAERISEDAGTFSSRLHCCAAQVLLVGIQSSGRGHRCTIVAGFFHYSAGFVVPSAVKYIMECHARARFLVRNFSKDSHAIIWEHFGNSVRFTIFLTLFFLLAPLVIMRAFSL